jgi:hypothetical protein
MSPADEGNGKPHDQIVQKLQGGLKERVELNAMASDALMRTIERELQEYGLEKVNPGRRPTRSLSGVSPQPAVGEQIRGDEAHDEGYQNQGRHRLEKASSRHPYQTHGFALGRAVQIVLDKTQLSEVRANKEKAKKKSGDFTGKFRPARTRRITPCVRPLLSTGGREEPPAKGGRERDFSPLSSSKH